MILKSYFGNENNEEKDPYRALRQTNKEWIPNEINHNVATYIENFEKDFKNTKPATTRGRDNLSKGERIALNSLKQRDDVIITHADKGGAVVIIEVSDYIEEAERQLKDVDFYAELTHDPTEKHAEIINSTIRGFIAEKLIGKN